MGEVRTRVWTAVRDRSGVAGKASGRRRGGRSRAERRTWRADSSVAMLLMEALAIDAQKGGRHGDDLPELRPRHPVIQNGSPRAIKERARAFTPNGPVGAAGRRAEPHGDDQGRAALD